MSESVNLPALGESVTEGTVTRWLKAIGDQVEVDEPLVEISTDKVDTEIPSPIAGVLEQILVEEDETVEVGAPLAVIGDGSAQGDAPAEAEPASEESQQEEPQEEEVAAEEEAPAEASAGETPAEQDTASEESASEPAPAASEPEVAEEAPAPEAQETADAAPAVEDTAAGSNFEASTESYLTPIVRKLANDNGVDLSQVSGTGVGGRIRKEDVLKAIEAQSGSKTAATTQVSQTPQYEVSELRGTSAPFSRLRKIVAKRAVESLQETAQLTTVVEVDVTNVARLRDRVKEEFLSKTGNKLSFLPFFAKAAVEALQVYPIINSTVEDETIIYPSTENLSIAVDTERGLLTPVVKDAAELDINGLAAQIADLAERTRTNKLKPEELSGGTFTLTNTGSRGALFDTPLVFLPQTAILGTGIVSKKPMVIGEGIQIRSVVYLAISYDHRIIDGADAARFLSMVKSRLEAGEFENDLGI